MPVDSKTSLEPLLHSQDAGIYLRLHPKTVIKMARLKQLPAFVLGNIGASVRPTWPRGLPNRYNRLASRTSDGAIMSTTRNNRYQEGSIDRVSRAEGRPDVWVYRWRELQEAGLRVQRKKTIGDVNRYPKLADAKRAVENLRAEINAQQERVGKTTVADAWGHFQLHELRDPDVDRSPTTVKSYLDYFKVQILPQWDVPLDEVKSVAVEKWLRSLDLANGTKAKIRNHMSALLSHCIRHELYDKLNPIASVRQSAVRQRDPDYLTLEEMTAIITKTIGWHTFRHSVGSHLGQSGENVKVVQELLRHASSRITQDVYQQADQGAKRTALGRFSGVLAFPAKKTT